MKKADLEIPMARDWWNEFGGSLCWLYPLVHKQRGVQQQRVVDAVVRHDRPAGWIDGRRQGWRMFGHLGDADIGVLQVKACALTKPLVGQTFFSGLLARRAGANVVWTTALCTETDPELEAISRRLAHRESMELRVVVRNAPRNGSVFRLTPAVRAIQEAARSDARLSRGFLSLDVPLRPRSHFGAAVVAHGAVFFDRIWHHNEPLDRRAFMLLSESGGYGFGMYVLGDALMNRELARRRYPSAFIESGVVVPRDDAVMRELATGCGIHVFIV